KVVGRDGQVPFGCKGFARVAADVAGTASHKYVQLVSFLCELSRLNAKQTRLCLNLAGKQPSITVARARCGRVRKGSHALVCAWLLIWESSEGCPLFGPNSATEAYAEQYDVQSSVSWPIQIGRPARTMQCADR